MEQEVLKILSSGKNLERYERMLHLLNSEDSGEYEEDEEQPQRKKRFLGWGCIGKHICAYYSTRQEKSKCMHVTSAKQTATQAN